ncbi:MAG: LysM peptidoglycan-binding domain-containing protein [Muribaculaceae bacterium]|nr:LysM peptidoglycan-binding domain-containing protein [Muribaculaceae bacterium]
MKKFLSLFLILTALSLHAQTMHVVSEGETIESIATQYGVSAEDLVKLNPGAESLFFNGMKLSIPDMFSFSTNASTGKDAYKENYRRSSLCLILLAHSDKQYAEGMTRVFQAFPMPARYNEHNVDVRVVNVKGKQKKEDIDRILRQNKVSQSLVSKWFNRDPYSGGMNMDLIHDRGGYGAFYQDYERVIQTVRGTSLLREEGIDLLENTFVLVCDMDYIDKKKGFKIGSLVTGLLSVASEAMSVYSGIQAQNEYSKGNYAAANKKAQQSAAWGAGAQLGYAGAAVLDDLGGFRVNVHSYLYRLKWDDTMTDALFNNYWVDSTTPNNEAQRRKERFDNTSFGLEYLGDYKEASGKTILRSWSNEDEVILDVCERAVAKGITNLSKKYEIFRPRTPFYFEDDMLYSHIGAKEDVVRGKKYEVVQKKRDKKGKTSFKKLGEVEAVTAWDNKNVRFDDYFDTNHKGTAFRVTKGKTEDLAMTPGLQIREKK